MKKKDFIPEFWKYIIDASSLINIERNEGINELEKRKGGIILPEQVAYEVAYDPRVSKSDPLRKFVLENPEVIIKFQDDEEEEYLRIARQSDIGPGEASAMAMALKRHFPLVIDERETKARGKANNHGITTLSSKDFLEGR